MGTHAFSVVGNCSRQGSYVNRSARQIAVALIACAMAISLGACDATTDPYSIVGAPAPSNARVPTSGPLRDYCADAQALPGGAGITSLATDIANGADAERIAPCADPEAVAALRALSADGNEFAPEPCRLLPNDSGGGLYCWATSPTGRSVTFAVNTLPGGAVLAGVSLGGGPYDGAVATKSVEELAQLPIERVAVRTDGYENVTGIQKFADDIYAGDVSKLEKYCWTMAPEYIASHYGTPQARGAILDALTHALAGTEYGLSTGGQLASVFFPYSEVDSSYPCAIVNFTGIDDAPAASDYAWTIHRLAGRLSGSPVSAHDTEYPYNLYCENDPSDYLSQQGVEREGEPPTAQSHAAVDQVIRQLDGMPLAVRRNATLGVTLVTDASHPGGPALVWYELEGGSCLGDTWS
jgi:hypothetical protein